MHPLQTGRSEAQPNFLALRRERSEAELRFVPLSIGLKSSSGIHCEAFTVARLLRSKSSPLGPLQLSPRRLARQLGLFDFPSEEPLEGVPDGGRRPTLDDCTVR